ncbi:putative glucuronosyltransferase [Platanthera guangdongensis]|uniref:Glycosyltransferases n=1 Tax=Platanthera guangdongensis TaxID=2320717 RepID=A0ABR2LDC6_9ASPA
MTSLRKSTSVAQRDGAVPIVYEDLDTSSHPKTSHSRTYLILGRILNSFLSSLGLVMESDRIKTVVYNIFHLRSSRPVERSKVRGLFLKGVVFRFFIFFLVGLIVGFTPIPIVDQSKNNLSRHGAFSFHEPVIGKFQTSINSVDNDILLTQKSLPKGHINLEASTKLEMENKTLNASHSLYSSHDFALVSSKLLIIVTPTYSRPFQSFYLNRLAQTLRNVPHPLLWIVVEMSLQSDETVKILRDTGVMYRHLVGDHNVTSVKDTVIQLRNVALYHIERHQLDGIVLFADDDKIYSLGLFDKMVEIRRFGTWPVAVLTEDKKRAFFEGPVCKGREIVGWHTHQTRLSRRFQIDMSGFAFNSTILWDPKRWHRPNIDLIRLHDSVRVGFQESKFVEQLVEDESQMEGLSENCSRILVWHLHLEAPQLLYPSGWLFERNLENLIPLML